MEREKKLPFGTIIRCRNVPSKIRGNIDFVATKNGVVPLAVKFGNTNVLKYNNIEKIVRFPGVGIGVVAGRHPVDNKHRVETMMDDLDHLQCNDFWIAEIEPRTVSCFTRDGEPSFMKWHVSDMEVVEDLAKRGEFT